MQLEEHAEMQLMKSADSRSESQREYHHFEVQLAQTAAEQIEVQVRTAAEHTEMQSMEAAESQSESQSEYHHCEVQLKQPRNSLQLS